MYCNAATGGQSHGHRGSAQKMHKDQSGGSKDMLADRQTHTDTQTNRMQYSCSPTWAE